MPGQYDTSSDVRFVKEPSVFPRALLPILEQPFKSNSSRATSRLRCTTPSSVMGHRANRKMRRVEDRPGCCVSTFTPASVTSRHHPKDSSFKHCQIMQMIQSFIRNQVTLTQIKLFKMHQVGNCHQGTIRQTSTAIQRECFQ